MKTLTLLRHAKSSWNDAATRDFDRPLNARGQRAARAMGREMRRLGLGFDRVVASPALRVVETLRGAEEGYGGSLDTGFERRIYLASPEALLEIVHDSDDAVSSLLLAGHSPGLEGLALMLSAAGDLRDQLEIKYPTGTLAEIRLPVACWADASPASGTLTRFIRPRDLDPELGPDEDS